MKKLLSILFVMGLLISGCDMNVDESDDYDDPLEPSGTDLEDEEEDITEEDTVIYVP